MNVNYRIIFFLIIYFLSNSLASQETNTFGEVEEEINVFLGFSLTPSSGGGLVHFGIIEPLHDGKLRITQISSAKFLRIAKGQQKTSVNPKLINFLIKYNIGDTIINHLWRLRYAKYPYHSMEPMGRGWAIRDSATHLPIDYQRNILRGYGINSLYDYCYGENAFKLLRDMSDKNWSDIYKKLTTE